MDRRRFYISQYFFFWKNNIIWTEERLFLEGLELYGREWKKIENHINTRDVHAIKSHAQKHFIKLYRLNQPLPAKVQETGTGHTLSGKPLDPNSGAAQQYLGKKKNSLNKNIPKNENNNNDNSNINNNNLINNDNKVNIENKNENQQILNSPKFFFFILIKIIFYRKKNEKKKTPIRETDFLPYIKQESEEQSYDQSGRTIYAKSRLRGQSSSNQNQ